MKNVFLIITPLLLFTGCQNAQLQVNGREEWLKMQTELLHEFKPDPVIPAVVPQKIDARTVEIPRPQGLIRFPGNKWVYFISCSSHDTPADIILAIDNTGRVFANNGHVCPTFALRWASPRNLNSPDDFFASEVSPGTGRSGSAKWIRIKKEQKREEQ